MHHPTIDPSKVQGWDTLNVEFRFLNTSDLMLEFCSLVFKDRS